METPQIVSGLDSAIASLQQLRNNVAGEPLINHAPTVAQVFILPPGTVGMAYLFRIPDTAFTDIDGDVLTYTVFGLPDGLSASGPIISGTPKTSGNLSVTVRVEDPSHAAVDVDLELPILPAPVVVQPDALELLDPICDLLNNSFTFQSTGGDGKTPKEYMAAGIMGWSTNPVHGIDEGLRQDALKGARKTVTMMVRQGSVVVKRDFVLATNVPTSGIKDQPGATNPVPDTPTIPNTKPDHTGIVVDTWSLPGAALYNPDVFDPLIRWKQIGDVWRANISNKKEMNGDWTVTVDGLTETPGFTDEFLYLDGDIHDIDLCNVPLGTAFFARGNAACSHLLIILKAPQLVTN